MYNIFIFLREKGHFFHYRAYFEGNLLCFVRARANDANIVRSRDTQCDTKESPEQMCKK